MGSYPVTRGINTSDCTAKWSSVLFVDQSTSQEVVSSVGSLLWEPLWITSMSTSKFFSL